MPHIPLEQVLALFRQQNVTGILATSRPNDGTRALVETKPRGLRVVFFIRPYRVRADIQTWLAQLPQGVAEKIAFRNAEQLFKR